MGILSWFFIVLFSPLAALVAVAIAGFLFFLMFFMFFAPLATLAGLFFPGSKMERALKAMVR